MKNEIRWAFAGGKAQGVSVLASLVEAGFVPMGVCASVADELAILKTLCPDAETADSPDWEGLDLILTCRFRLLPPETFSRPKWGAVNLHSSLLPKYRGVHPVSWALVDGQTETGVTLHRIDAGIDTGPVLEQAVVPIEVGDDLWTLTQKLDQRSVQLAVDFFEKLSSTGVFPKGKPQSGPSSYARRRLPEDGAFSFDWTSRKIRDLIRALPPPMPMAFASTAKGKFAASRCEILKEGGAPPAAPGTVVSDEAGFEFATADGLVRLEGEWI